MVRAAGQMGPKPSMTIAQRSEIFTVLSKEVEDER